MMKNFIFGYGSLIEKNSRLRTTPGAETPYPVKVKGLMRGWFGRTGVPGLSTTFLSCLKMEEAPENLLADYVNGIVYEVTGEELLLTDRREKGYKRIKIAAANIEDYTGILDEDATIWVYINEMKKAGVIKCLPCKEFPIVQSYVDICINGCLEIENLYPDLKEKSFTADFIRSTQYWNSYWANDRVYPRRPFITVPNAHQIDIMLRQHLTDDSLFDKIYIE